VEVFIVIWNEINTLVDLETFMTKFGGFHDSCIKELKYISGAFVSSDLSMNPINSTRTVKIIIQRQYKDPMAVEMEFAGLQNLVLAPADENFTCELEGASMFINDGKVYWYDSDSVENPIEGYDGTWICANRVRWRNADEYMGSKEIY
jgi:hypothetical protein